MTVQTASEPLLAPPLLETPHPAAFVLFGATGDLAARKILPAVYDLAHDGALPEAFALIGVARDRLTTQEFRDLWSAVVHRYARHTPDERVLAELLDHADYVGGPLDAADTYASLAGALEGVERDAGLPLDHCHHLAVPPDLFATVIARLGEHGLARREHATVRVVVEKPYGNSLEDARRLNLQLSAVLSEDQVFRIDHFLGTQTVQNLLALRFANTLLEPTWSRYSVDHVEITAAEDFGVGGDADSYEGTGALRDVVQNHLLQILCHVAMEPPARFGTHELCNEKVKVLASIPAPAPSAAVRGQYAPGTVGGHPVRGYRDEPGVAPGSQTETYAAVRLTIENWRWAGVPFYLRAGKRLARTATEIAVTLREVPHMAFAREDSDVRPNELILTVEPAEGVALMLTAKVPGGRMRLSPVKMETFHELAFGAPPPKPYETLILDALRGDGTLFTRADEVEEQWRIVEPLVEAWEASSEPPALYPAGSQGPREAEAILLPGDEWRPI